MSEKHKKVCSAFNYWKHFLAFLFAVSGCVLNSAFDLLVGVLVDIEISTVGGKICAITFAIRKYKSIVKKKKKNHYKIVLLPKAS